MTATARGLFATAFSCSRNAMVLLDADRVHVDANRPYLDLVGYSRRQLLGKPVYDFVADGPLATPAEWEEALATGEFTGESELVRPGGDTVAVEWAASTEVVTGRQLVLFVVLTERWGPKVRRDFRPDAVNELTRRERQVIGLVALGHNSSEIAEQLVIAPDTVSTHVRNSMKKTGARSRAHLVAKTLGDGRALA